MRISTKTFRFHGANEPTVRPLSGAGAPSTSLSTNCIDAVWRRYLSLSSVGVLLMHNIISRPLPNREFAAPSFYQFLRILALVKVKLWTTLDGKTWARHVWQEQRINRWRKWTKRTPCSCRFCLVLSKERKRENRRKMREQSQKRSIQVAQWSITPRCMCSYIDCSWSAFEI